MKRIGTLLVGCALILTTVACSNSQSGAPTPTAVSTESAQLAAAVDAFTVFNAAFDGYSSGTTSIDSLEPLVTADYLAVLTQQDPAYSEQRISGATSFDSVELTTDAPRDEFPNATVVTLCRNLSRTQVIDQAGNVVEVPDRMTRVPLIVYLVPSDADPQSLLVAEMDQWPSPEYCS